jgi:hypothetical protein
VKRRSFLKLLSMFPIVVAAAPLIVAQPAPFAVHFDWSAIDPPVLTRRRTVRVVEREPTLVHYVSPDVAVTPLRPVMSIRDVEGTQFSYDGGRSWQFERAALTGRFRE